MAEEATSTTEAPQADAQSDSGEPLGDGGKKALDAERRRASAAEKALKAVQSQLDDINAKTLSKEEAAEKRASEAEARAQAAEAKSLRYEIAAQHGINRDDADLFLTGTDEDTLTRQAERLAEHTKKPEGLYVPAEGHQPSAPALNSDELETSLRKKLGIPT